MIPPLRGRGGERSTVPAAEGDARPHPTAAPPSATRARRPAGAPDEATVALAVDRYLDRLLGDRSLRAADRAGTDGGTADPDAPDAGAGRGTLRSVGGVDPPVGAGDHTRRPAAEVDAPVDAATRRAAETLRRALVRVHPSFRFEERLARRLAEAADRARLASAAGAEGLPLGPLGPLAPVVPLERPESREAASLGRAVVPFPAGRASEPQGDASPSPGRGEPRGPQIRPLLIGGAMASAALSIAGAAAYVAWRRGRPIDPMTWAIRAAHDPRRLRLAGRLTRAAGRGRLA